MAAIISRIRSSFPLQNAVLNLDAVKVSFESEYVTDHDIMLVAKNMRGRYAICDMGVSAKSSSGSRCMCKRSGIAQSMHIAQSCTCTMIVISSAKLLERSYLAQLRLLIPVLSPLLPHFHTSISYNVISTGASRSVTMLYHRFMISCSHTFPR